MIVQAVVDHEYIFRDVCIGWPGSVHDARVFANSAIFKKINDDKILDKEGLTRVIMGRDIPICILGDSAYPLQTWLMKPFANSGTLTHDQQHFNYRLSHARIVVENAFGRLKARWRRLSKKNDMSIEHIPTIICACCILHNICEIHGESFDEEWLQLLDNDDDLTAFNLQLPPCAAPSHIGTPNQVHDTFVQYFATQ